MLAAAHGNEIDDYQTGQIPQPNLSGNLHGGGHIRRQNGIIDTPLCARRAQIDINDRQRLCKVKGQSRAPWQVNGSVSQFLDLIGNPIGFENRFRLIVELNIGLQI